MEGISESPRWEKWMLAVWLAGSTLFLFGMISLALRSPTLQLQFGLFEAPGATAIWTLLAAGICGTAAIIALLNRRAVAAPVLSLLFSGFWLVMLCGGMVVAASRTTMAAVEGYTWETWLVGGTMYLTVVAGFLLTALWSVDQLRD